MNRLHLVERVVEFQCQHFRFARCFEEIAVVAGVERMDIECEAFDRAKGYYTDTIDRQEREIQGLEADVVTLKGQVVTAQSEIRDLRAELDTAKRTLRRAFPDAL